MFIYKIDMYLDGGTHILDTDEGKFYIDNRIDTQTRGLIYGMPPDMNLEPLDEPFQTTYRSEILGAKCTSTAKTYFDAVVKLLTLPLNAKWG